MAQELEAFPQHSRRFLLIVALLGVTMISALSDSPCWLVPVAVLGQTCVCVSHRGPRPSVKSSPYVYAWISDTEVAFHFRSLGKQTDRQDNVQGARRGVRPIVPGSKYREGRSCRDRGGGGQDKPCSSAKGSEVSALLCWKRRVAGSCWSSPRAYAAQTWDASFLFLWHRPRL